MQGRSFKTMIHGGDAPDDWREAVYYRYWMQLAHHYVPAHYGIRTTDHKLIFYYGLPLDASGAVPEQSPAGWQFFDLSRDPDETIDLYRDPKYTETIASLKDELLELKAEIGDTDERYPELMAVREQAW